VTTTIVALWKTPNDREGFEAHYLGTHIPIVRELPKLKEVAISKVLTGPYYRMAELVFESAEDLGAALSSEAGGRLLADTSHLQDTFATTADVLTVEEG